MVENDITKDQLSTLITLPLESFENNSLQVSEPFTLNKNNALFKTTGDRQIYIININNVNLDDVNVLPQVLETLGITTDTPLQPQNEVAEPADTTIPVIEIPEIEESPPKPKPHYKCRLCEESFDKASLYRRHVLSHKSIKKFKCEKCDSSYNIESNLKIHMAIHSEGSPKCPICGTEFNRWASLRSHLLVHQVEELYTCDDCKAEFEKEEELIKHLRTHLSASGSELYCSSCKLQFDDAKEYKDHQTDHAKIKKMTLTWRKSRRNHGNREFAHVCGVCRKSFAKASLLERHSRVHSGERPFVCIHCKKGFNQKGTLQIHMSKHSGERRFECTLCPARFNQRGNLRVHVAKTHIPPSADVRTYKCTHCPCIFKKLASLNVHITKTHPIEKQPGGAMSLLMTQLRDLEQQAAVVTPGMKSAEKEVIEQNKKVLEDVLESNESNNISYVRLAESFLDGSVRRYLVKQKKVNDSKVYICNYCSKEFKKPSDLIRHTRVHTREKPFKCKECAATFSLKTSLYSHMKTHAGNNNYVCPYCLKKFSSMRSVNLHVKKHVEDGSLLKHKAVKVEKHFDCKICNKKFVSTSSLKKHLISHDKLTCSQCDMTFATEFQCKTHLITHVKVDSLEDALVEVEDASDLKLSSLPDTLLDVAVDPILMSGLNVNSLPDPIEQQMYEIHSGANNSQDQIQTIFVNLPDNSNNLYPKIQSNDSLLFNSLGDLSDVNVFNIDQLGELESQSPYIYSNQIFNNFLNGSTQIEESEKSPKDQCKDKTLINEPLLDLNLALNEVVEQSFPVNVSIPSPTLIPGLESQENTVFELEPNFIMNNLENNPIKDIIKKEPPVVLEDDSTSGSEWNKRPPVRAKKKRFTCPQCKKVFASRHTWSRHLNSSHANNKGDKFQALHKCTCCPKEFKKHSDLKRHLRTHTGERPFPCDKCEKKFSLKSTLLSHLRTHNPTSHKDYNCSVCNSFFTSKSSLKVHMNLHTGLKPHQCTFCPMKFRTATHKKSHETSQHTNPSRSKKSQRKVTNLLATMAMDAVNSNAGTNQDLMDNILVVQDPAQLSGDLNLPLSEPIQLDPSLLQQLQSSNFLIQDQFITSVIQLENGTLLNIRTDSNGDLNLEDLNNALLDSSREPISNVVVEKPRNLECEICHKKYASKDVLRKHKKTHGVFRKFPCSKCDKGFDTEDALEKHEKVHAGYRPFTCQVCDNSFSKVHSLATHMKRMHSKTVTKS